jgi:hypothetical protein
MKKLLSLYCALFIVLLAAAQQYEELTPLGYNPAVYKATKQFQPAPGQHRYVIDKGIMIVNANTVNIPFVDDFSTNRLGTVNWYQNHITDTFHNVYGSCLANESVPMQVGNFILDSSYTYTYNLTTHSVDSVANLPYKFTYFGPSPTGCFNQLPQYFEYWDTYYRYTFDTLGRATDSVMVGPDTILSYAPVIYFAQNEPGTLWFDAYAYRNNTYPVNPPTIGVATLDGLNEYGLPYNNSSTHTYGTADYLTSKPIDLSAILSDDTTVYLSFFYEGGGLGDYPDRGDSLIVEFLDNAGRWNIMWYDTGYLSPAVAPQKFQRVLINLPQLQFPLTYFHNVFQFRFRNKASLYGNNDHWHIDYVELDKNRGYADTIIQEIAFVYPLPTILKNFTLMPADQFNYPVDLRDTLIVPVHNLDPNANNNPPATNFTKLADELYPVQSPVLTSVLQTFNAAEYSYIGLNPATEYIVPTTPNWPVDSLVIQSRVLINPNDVIKSNDTLYQVQHFDNTLAYDDGSAELAYGISGAPGTKKFAYEFNLNYPDTLVAFQVQFSQVESNVSDLVFNFNAWDSLSLNNYAFNDDSTLIFSLDNKKPYYIDSVNGFTTYRLAEPIIISNKIYFGWSQTDSRKLQIGYDVNSTLGRSHMYIYTNGKWSTSSIPTAGSPMIRLIFDSNYYGGTSPVTEVEDDIKTGIYPNPTTGMLQIKTNQVGVNFNVQIMNMVGQTVFTSQNVASQLDLSGLSNGIYLLELTNPQTGKTYNHKVIKTGI